MSMNFEFNAPQFVSKSEDFDADRFFDISCEPDNVQSSKSFNSETALNSSENFELENKDPCISTNNCNATSNCNAFKKSPTRRKVLNELVTEHNQGNSELLLGMENLSISNKKCNKLKKIAFRRIEIFEGIHINRLEEKQHPMVTRLDSCKNTPCVDLRNRCIPKMYPSLDLGLNHDSSVGQKLKTPIKLRKSGGIKRKGVHCSAEKKFVSLAERVQHFHYDTPDRFRTIPKKRFTCQNTKPSQTIPKTPNLLSKNRQRPINFPNEKEREEMELIEMKKHQIKAHPLNEKILKEPVLNLKFPVEKKVTTVPEPFKLTEVKKKDVVRSPVFIFKAQPVPTSILKKTVAIPPKKLQKSTASLPNIKIDEKFTIETTTSQIKILNSEHNFLPKPTKVQPFSFDQKIKESLMRKEENIRRVLEEEKKSFNSFKAQPIPSFIGKTSHSHSSLNHIDSNVNSVTLSSGAKKKENNKNIANCNVFKAKPALVIYQKPFTPVLRKYEGILPEHLQLNTEKRALERQKFDEKIKKKEEIITLVLQKQKEEEERLEKLKKLEERKLTEFKARPMPKYKPS